MRFLVLLFCLFWVAVPARAQVRLAHAAAPAAAPSVLDDPFVRFQAKRGLDMLYDMRFAKAARIFEQVDQLYPDHPIGPFLLALNTWWTILLDLSDTSHDDAFYAAMEEVIRRSDRRLARDRNDFDALFFKGAALGFRGRMRSNRGEWLKAAMDGKGAMDYVHAVARRAPEDHDFIFGKGIYDYYVAAMPERYPLAKPLLVFFPKGDRARGLEALERTATQGHYLRTEAAYFLLQIHYLFEGDFAGSVRYVTQLREAHPANPFFHTFEGRVYARWGHWRQSREVFLAVLDAYEQDRPGYNAAAAEQALYFLARGAMASAEYDAALSHLKRLEQVAARSSLDTYFKTMGRLRRGMAYDAVGERARAVQLYRQVLTMKAWGDAHVRARRYLERPYGG